MYAGTAKKHCKKKLDKMETNFQKKIITGTPFTMSKVCKHVCLLRKYRDKIILSLYGCLHKNMTFLVLKS